MGKIPSLGTPQVPVSIPWTVQEWCGTKVRELQDDWRFFAFLGAWKEDILKHERAKFYIDLVLLSEKSIPATFVDLFDQADRLEKLVRRSRGRVISEQEIERILLNAYQLIQKQPPFFPCSALLFEFVTVVSDFCDTTIKKSKLYRAKHIKELADIIGTAAVGYAMTAVNEHFGLIGEWRRRLPRGRIPRPPGRRSFSHYCPQCRRLVVQKVLFSYVNHEVDPGIPTEYTLTECSRCREPGLFMREDEGLGFLPKTEHHLWRGESRKHAAILPSEVARHYQVALNYEKECKWDIVVLEVGRTLEAIVKHFLPEVRNLADGLRRLDETKIITADLYEWANELRVLRNLSAHASCKSFTEWEATTAFDFLDAIVETVFWTRSQFEQFRRSRSNGDAKRT